MIIIRDAIASFIKTVKNTNKTQRVIAFAVASVMLAAFSVVSAGVRVTYNVKYNDTVLANISNVEVYEVAMEKAHSFMSDSDATITEAELEPVVTVNAVGASADEVTELILDNAPSVCFGYEVTAGGKCLAYVEALSVVEELSAERLASFNVKGAECENSFADELEISEAYFHIDDLSDEASVTAAINTLDVITVATKKTVYAVSYDTETKKDSTKKAGYEKVLTAGVNGENQKVETVTYLNGVPTSEPVVSEEVLKYPINEVVLIGTKNVYVSSAPLNAAASGFKWPLEIRGTITSYWGDDRGHKGVDIGVPVGTQAIAVKDGTVVEATFTSDYGYYVTIDHGNGVKTRYAHNSKNLVSVGQKVTAGQVIVLTGNTGRSTGPHLHFEVIINGTRVNPASYIGL